MRYLWLVCTLSICKSIRAQSTNADKYQELISDVVFHKTFVDEKPLCFPEYRSAAQKALSAAMTDSTRDPGLTESDMNAFQTAIENAKNPDTTAWKDEELKDCALVRSGSPVDRKYALAKFQPANRTDRHYFSGLIDAFNKPNGYGRWTSSFSRPVFDRTGTYAILINQLRGANLGCFFYKWNGTKWVEVLNVSPRS
jgi:hypothetical protein